MMWWMKGILYADKNPPKAERLHSILTFPPPQGPGLRVKLYWLQEKLLFWLDGTPVMHPKKPDFQYKETMQKAVDVGLVYHRTRSYMNRKWNKLVLIAGDGDFHEPIQDLVEKHGVDLYLMGTVQSISDELKPYARKIFDLTKEPLWTDLAYAGKKHEL